MDNTARVVKSQLYLISRINEQIKTVARLSHQINVGAINARLLARQSNSGSQGYRVAAAELGVFSQRLAEIMQTMVTEVEGLLSETAFHLKLSRRRAILTFGNETGENKYLQSSVDILTRELDDGSRKLESSRNFLQMQMMRARELNQSGRVIGRLARLESVYGGPLASAMSTAVLAIEDIVLQINAVLCDLEKQLWGTIIEKY